MVYINKNSLINVIKGDKSMKINAKNTDRITKADAIFKAIMDLLPMICDR